MRRYRQTLMICLLGTVIFGLITKFYPGPGQVWLNHSFGGIPYEIAFILLAAWLWPRTHPVWIALGVLGGTIALEFLQLWQPPWFQAIRATLLGRLVLGNSFSWSDFPYYIVGCVLGGLWLATLKSHTLIPAKENFGKENTPK